MKTKNLLLIAIIGLIPIKLFSQTEVGGTLIGNTTWIVDESPYTITSTIGVVPGDTLVIQPGVKISGGGRKIIVKGTIVANGKIENMIEFNNVKVLFEDTDLSGSKFSHISFNSSGIQIADDFEEINNNKVSGKLKINKCFFSKYSYVTSHGYETEEIVEIDSSIFNEASINDKMYSYNHLIVRNCEILNSTINIAQYSKRTNFDNCNISNTKIFIGPTREFKISNSKIFNSYIKPISDYQTIKLDSSIIINTPIKMVVEEYEWQNFNLTIDHCIIKDSVSELIYYRNTNVKNSILINEGGIVLNLLEGVNISHSLISGGINDTKGAIVINSYNNTVSNTNSNIKNSNFINCKSYIIKNMVDGNINAQENYWESTVKDTISERIYDIYDNINYGKVDFADFLSFPDTITPISPPSCVLKSFVNDSIIVSWNSNPESDLLGYRIYYNPIDNFLFKNFIDVGKDTSYAIDGISLDDTIVVVAYDKHSDGVNDLIEGHVSWYSSFAKDTTNNMIDFVSSNQEKSNFITYPNPFSDIFYVRNVNNISDFAIYSIDGKLLIKGESSLLNAGVNTTNLNKGVYILRIKQYDKIFIMKVIKQ